MATSALGTAAPDESVTVPESVPPATCASKGCDGNKQRPTIEMKSANLINFGFIDTHLFLTWSGANALLARTNPVAVTAIISWMLFLVNRPKCSVHCFSPSIDSTDCMPIRVAVKVHFSNHQHQQYSAI